MGLLVITFVCGYACVGHPWGCSPCLLRQGILLGPEASWVPVPASPGLGLQMHTPLMAFHVGAGGHTQGLMLVWKAVF